MLKKLKELPETTFRQAALPAVSLVFGLLALAVAITVSATTQLGAKHLAAVIGFWIAQTLIGAGVVVGVMRALQSADYFAHGLRHVLYNDDLPDGPIDYHRSWRGLTLALLRRRFGKLEVGNDDVLPGSLMGAAEFYYSEHKRFLNISWQDRSKNVIRISDRVETTVVTGDVGQAVRFSNWFKPEADTSRRRGIACTFRGGYERVLGDADMIEKDGMHGFEVDLPPSSVIGLTRQFEKEQDLDEDPILNYMSICLVHRPRVTVRCEAGLRFYFRKMGVPADFVVEGTNADLNSPLQEVVVRYDGLCFRNQGYIIVVVKERTE